MHLAAPEPLFARDPAAGPPEAALAGLRGRFRSWVGRSGRRYVVSTFAAADCPDFDDALVLLVRRGRVVGALDVGAGSPGEVAAALQAHGAEEAHVHLLAAGAAARAAVARDLGLSDLGQRGPDFR